MTLSLLVFSAAVASQPLAVWSGSDTGLGQELRAVFERAVAASAKFRTVQAPQGSAPSLLVDDMQLDGGDVAFRVSVYSGMPGQSKMVWSYSGTCPRDRLARCAGDIVERLPDLSES